MTDPRNASAMPAAASMLAAPAPSAESAAARHRHVPTALGDYVLAAEGDSLTGLWRAAQSRYPRAERLGLPAPSTDSLLTEAEEQLLAYLAGDRTGFDLPLAPRGTAFQQSVWDLLRAIPRGETTTYRWIARELDRPRAAQAVGAAVGSNPISIVVPCHRVLATSGAMTGYAGGIETKQALLRLEGVLLA